MMRCGYYPSLQAKLLDLRLRGKSLADLEGQAETLEEFYAQYGGLHGYGKLRAKASTSGGFFSGGQVKSVALDELTGVSPGRVNLVIYRDEFMEERARPEAIEALGWLVEQHRRLNDYNRTLQETVSPVARSFGFEEKFSNSGRLSWAREGWILRQSDTKWIVDHPIVGRPAVGESPQEALAKHLVARGE